MRRACRWRGVLLAAVLAIGLPVAGAAQSFSQNKVHYKSFEFEALRTRHVDVTGMMSLRSDR
ncbi:MAG TPA: hypothetical protein VGK32_03240 [Vicinamibacterales bacterium]|jgi:hypothetical protein